jgi:hypothetical protein
MPPGYYVSLGGTRSFSMKVIGWIGANNFAGEIPQSLCLIDRCHSTTDYNHMFIARQLLYSRPRNSLPPVRSRALSALISPTPFTMSFHAAPKSHRITHSSPSSSFVRHRLSRHCRIANVSLRCIPARFALYCGSLLLLLPPPPPHLQYGCIKYHLSPSLDLLRSFHA